MADWFNHGGITRDVMLVETPKTFVSNYYIALDKSTLNDKVRKINGAIFLSGKDMPQSLRGLDPTRLISAACKKDQERRTP